MPDAIRLEFMVLLLGVMNPMVLLYVFGTLVDANNQQEIDACASVLEAVLVDADQTTPQLILQRIASNMADQFDWITAPPVRSEPVAMETIYTLIKDVFTLMSDESAAEHTHSALLASGADSIRLKQMTATFRRLVGASSHRFSWLYRILITDYKPQPPSTSTNAKRSLSATESDLQHGVKKAKGSAAPFESSKSSAKSTVSIHNA
jgi:aryl carrier-like protein